MTNQYEGDERRREAVVVRLSKTDMDDLVAKIAESNAAAISDAPFESNHCQAAYLSEITGKQLPKGVQKWRLISDQTMSAPTTKAVTMRAYR